MSMFKQIESVAMRKWDVLQERNAAVEVAIPAMVRSIIIAVPGTTTVDAMRVVRLMLAKRVGIA